MTFNEDVGLFCTEVFSPKQVFQGLHRVAGNRKMLISFRDHLWDSGSVVSVHFLDGSEVLHNLV